jgi:acylphosphatase
MSEKSRAHIFVSGKVQGVFFRQGTDKKAKELGIFGWVQNLPDGRVEIVLEGDKDKVEEMVKWAKRGPYFARVKTFVVDLENYINEFKTFDKR